MLTLKVERSNGSVEIYSGKTIKFNKQSKSYNVDDQKIDPIVNDGDSSFVTNENGKTVFDWGVRSFLADDVLRYINKGRKKPFVMQKSPNKL